MQQVTRMTATMKQVWHAWSATLVFPKTMNQDNFTFLDHCGQTKVSIFIQWSWKAWRDTAYYCSSWCWSLSRCHTFDDSILLPKSGSFSWWIIYASIASLPNWTPLLLGPEVTRPLCDTIFYSWLSTNFILFSSLSATLVKLNLQTIPFGHGTDMLLWKRYPIWN